MSYRDDRQALREQAEALERELDQTRAELERLRHGTRVEPEPPLSPGRSPLLIALLVVFALATELLPLPPPVRIAIVVLAVSLLVMGEVLRSTLVLARPSEVVVLSGRKRRTAANRIVGFRVIRGGRAVRLPLIETTTRLDLGAFRLPIRVRGTDADFVVHARVAPNEPELDYAVERLLGLSVDSRNEIIEAAVEPAIASAIAKHDAAELRQQRDVLADEIRDAAAEPLAKIGVELLAVYVFDPGSHGVA